METDHRSFGDLFYACCDEVADISFLEALYRILTLATDRAYALQTSRPDLLRMSFRCPG